MADKTVVVRLRALVDDYKRQMADAAKATENVGKAGASFKQLAPRVQELGDSMTRRLTLPMAALGTAAAKLSLDFERSFSQMVGLAGVAAHEVDGLKQSVLDLSTATGRGPQELAEALYFIRSSGIAGQRALDALEVSAKAAAAGLGSTVGVADAVTSAMNAYATEGLQAAEATDVLVGAVREGKAEASQFAPQLGRLLPVASQLGVSFDQVAGGVAFLSRTSGDAALAATQLNGVLVKLLAPGQKGIGTLDEIGLSLQELRRVAGEEGLVPALELLRTKLEQNGLEFADFAEDQQFLQGALALTGQNAQAAAEVIGRVGDSVGATNQAFAEFAKTAGFQNQQAFAELQAGLIKLGDTVVPIAADILSVLSNIASAFAGLPGPMQAAVLGFAGFVAVLGPVLSTAGRIRDFRTQLEGMGRAGQLASTGLGKVGRAGVALAALDIGARAIGALVEALFPLQRANLPLLANSLLDLATKGEVAGEAARVFGPQLGELGDAFRRLETGGDVLDKITAKVPGVLKNLVGGSGLDEARQLFKDLDAALTDIARQNPQIAADLFASAARQIGASEDELREKTPLYVAALAELDTQQRTTGKSAKGMAGEMEPAVAQMQKAKEAADKAAAAIKELGDKLRAQFDPLFAAIDALQGNQDALAAAEQAQKDYTDAVAEFGSSSPEAVQAARDLEVAQLDVVKSALSIDEAMVNLAGAVRLNQVSVDDATRQLQVWVQQGLITQGQADITAAKFQAIAGQADSLHGRNVDVAITANTDQAVRAFAALQAALDQLQRNIAEGNVLAVRPGTGQYIPRRYGGAVTHAAAGHLTPGLYREGTLYGFAEPGTGGELFVPRRGIPRERAKRLLTVGAAWYGMDVVETGLDRVVHAQLGHVSWTGARVETGSSSSSTSTDNSSHFNVEQRFYGTGEDTAQASARELRRLQYLAKR